LLRLTTSTRGASSASRAAASVGPVPALEDVELEGFRSRNLTAWHDGGGLTYDITGGDVRPFVLLGAGGVSWSGAGDASTDLVLVRF
jgi:hypothetical protein